ncbi:copper resistance system multicopper oxidase, partial [Asaia siamensis]
MITRPRAGAGFSRRQFVTGLTGLGLAACTKLQPDTPLSATTDASAIPPAAASRYALTIDTCPWTIGRKTGRGFTVNGSVPAPTLRWREGDDMVLDVINRLDAPTSIHWHGIRLPADMDGVPGVSFAGVPAKGSFTYRFPVRQSGTYWYHSHSGMQEAQGLFGALVIDPKGAPLRHPDRDYVMVLSDWSDVAPHDIISNLKQQDDYYNFRQRTVASLFHEARESGLGSAINNRLMWSRMRMSATDISDVSGVIYTYLINGQSPDANWTGVFTPGERIRLRVINASAMTLFDFRIPGLSFDVIAADGQAVEPVRVEEFRIAPAETYDVIVQPTDGRAWTIFAQSEDRTGFARGTLAPQKGMAGPVPPMDPRPVRSMVDMGMG